MDIENDKMVIIDDEGKEQLVHVLFTFHSDERNKDYVLYYEDGNEDEVMVMSYNENHELFPVIDDEELDEVEEVLNAFQEDEEEESKNN